MVAFGSFEPVNIEAIRSKTVKFRLIDKVEDRLVSVATTSEEKIRVGHDLINDDG